MTLSRREFTALVSASAVRLSSQNIEGERLSTESVGAMLDAQGGRGLFADSEWLDLLRHAIELNAQTRASLRHYALSADAEPTITFLRY